MSQDDHREADDDDRLANGQRIADVLRADDDAKVDKWVREAFGVELPQKRPEPAVAEDPDPDEKMMQQWLRSFGPPEAA